MIASARGVFGPGGAVERSLEGGKVLDGAEDPVLLRTVPIDEELMEQKGIIMGVAKDAAERQEEELIMCELTEQRIRQQWVRPLECHVRFISSPCSMNA